MDAVNTVLKRIMRDARESGIIKFMGRENPDNDEIGRCYSALSNEASVSGADSAWMIFGITDKGEFVGSNHLDTTESRNKLKKHIAERTGNSMPFLGIFERFVDGRRILLFEIPSSQYGVPTTFKGIAYEIQDGRVLPLCYGKRIRIMGGAVSDWSRKVANEATLDDLDRKAMSMARKMYADRHPFKAVECSRWDDHTFLNKIGLMAGKGRITNAAIVLLGKAESSYLLEDVSVGIRRIVRAADLAVTESEVYGIPLLLAIDELCSEIHNFRYEPATRSAINPVPTDVYDPVLIREAVNNCVAHQDYLRSEYITVVEQDRESITFANAGFFIPRSVDDAINSDSPARFYRNKCLAEAMFRLGMVDIAGGGIIKMCRCQAKRAFPLPEYDLGNENVKVKIIGKMINSDFARILDENPDLRLKDIILLDMVQKGKAIPRDDACRFLSKGFVSGAYPDLVLGDGSIKSSGTRMPTDVPEFRAEVLAFIADNGPVSRFEIMDHVSDRLSDLSEAQKYQKLSNTLTALKKDRSIRMTGTRRDAKYLV